MLEVNQTLLRSVASEIRARYVCSSLPGYRGRVKPPNRKRSLWSFEMSIKDTELRKFQAATSRLRTCGKPKPPNPQKVASIGN